MSKKMTGTELAIGVALSPLILAVAMPLTLVVLANDACAAAMVWEWHIAEPTGLTLGFGPMLALFALARLATLQRQRRRNDDDAKEAVAWTVMRLMVPWGMVLTAWVLR